MSTTERSLGPVRHSAIITLVLLLLDAALVVLFAVAGNRSHSTGLSVSDVAGTAWPFLIGLLLGWALTRSWRQPSRLWPEGVVVVLITVALGMTLRVLLADGGAPLSFVAVATGSLALLLLGRRLVSSQMVRRR
ncbi:DUF3054 domain-containing protein [Nesterenkonia massiliensis]|uniref:DUF3054 domain-containing protein n=1 Tax=Nesterenkonia massiliensis TaxID=1232429 RepID=A0ABT2HRK7_9MICC|nr:DUF3054 domain-containing protein [Nesterenkonia massiliensis]MCT1607317.1 DUF3054 domain-containing protein [Nesterenkonia massiliensis]